MANTSIKVSRLPVSNTVTGTDRIVTLVNPSNTPVLVTVPVDSFVFKYSNTVPANSTSNGIAGTIAANSSFLYICISNGNWGRIAISNTAW